MLHDRLHRARVLRGLSLQQVADLLGDISKQALSKYEKGKDTPNSTRLLRLAEVLGVGPEYFFRPDSVVLGDVDFRKHSAFGKKHQAAIKEQVREHLERYLGAEHLFAVEGSGIHFSRWQECFAATHAEEAERAAQQLRHEWDLGSNPIANLTETLEEQGIKVVGLNAHDKFDGLCAVVNGGADAVIVSNIERPGERQRFNLAHELGHLVMRMPEHLHGTQGEEKLCHRFAGAFLFPAEQVRASFGGRRKRVLLEEFLLAKKEWGLSIQATLRRLYDLDVVSEGTYRSTFRHWSARGFRKAEPEALQPEASSRLRQLVCRALAEGLVTPSRAAELLNVGLAHIESIMADEQARDGKDASEGTCL